MRLRREAAAAPLGTAKSSLQLVGGASRSRSAKVLAKLSTRLAALHGGSRAVALLRC